MLKLSNYIVETASINRKVNISSITVSKHCLSKVEKNIVFTFDRGQSFQRRNAFMVDEVIVLFS